MVATWSSSLVITIAAFIAATPPRASVAARDPLPVAQIPFELHRNKILVPVTLNGAGPFPFILDTGSPVTILGASSLAQGLSLRLEHRGRVGGADEGEAPMARVSDPVAIGVGDVFVGRERLVVFEMTEALTPASGREYDGVIGKLLFDRFVVRIDFTALEIELYEPATYVPPATADVLPIRLEIGHPHLDTRVRLASGVEIVRDLVIDTGARPALMLDVEPGSGVVPPDRAVPMIVGYGARGLVRGVVGRVVALTLGASTLQDIVTVFLDDAVGATPRADGNLGVESLRRFRVTFDYPRQRMVLERGEHMDDPYPVDLSGIALRAAGPEWTTLVVAEVRPDSPAAGSGIRSGDEIESVDGESAHSLEEVERRLQRAGPVELELVRAGRRLRAQLHLVPIL